MKPVFNMDTVLIISPISGGQFVNQPPKRGAGERRHVSTLAQQHRSAKV